MGPTNRFRTLLGAICLSLAMASHSSATGGGLPLSKVTDVPLTGQATRWDYASLDASSGMLFMAHLGDSVVTVFDTRQLRVVADIPDIRDVHGVLAIPELGRVYASATGSNELVAIDMKTLKIVARVPAGNYPDGIAYAPEAHKIYVSDEHGGTDTVIDVRSNTRVATIKVGREVGNTQYDPISKHIFVNEQTSAELVEIDPSTDQILNRIKLPGAKGNHGLYIDAPARLAYIACEGNDKLLVLDLGTRKVTATFAVGAEPDVLAYDPVMAWLYVASESGVVTLFKQQDGKLQKLGEEFLGPNAHVVVADPAARRAYFPLKSVGGKSLLRVMQVPKEQ